jgi:lysozyme family protein
VKENFAPCLAAMLVHEGGYVLNSHDPGGATCKGVTQAVYDDWRRDHSLPSQSVRDIADIEVEAIYFNKYWMPIHGDSLPPGVDYASFDFAFNSGPNRAARFLQRVSGAAEDGEIGKQTLAAVENIPPLLLIDRLCDARLQFLQALNTFKFFGKGWTRRVAEVRARAKEMAS